MEKKINIFYSDTIPSLTQSSQLSSSLNPYEIGLRMTYRKQGTLIETSTCGRRKKKNRNYKTMHNKPIVSTQYAYFLAPPLSDLANDFVLKALNILTVGK